MHYFDLRSDTVTQPTPGMRQAIANAEVGDDVYGEDPTVNRLERQMTELTAKESAIFVSSGTFANQLAILCHTRRGDEIIVGNGAHCAFFESGAASAWAGVQAIFIGKNGLFCAEDIEPAIKPPNYYYPRTSLVCIENTHNRSGGRIFPINDIEKIRQVALKNKLRVHLDGARLWNAIAETKIDLSQWCTHVDTVSLCFSKGLGAPAGSVLCGEKPLIEEARRLRKMMGGGMRQAGILAAAAIFALEHHRQRLVQDHESARQIASALRDIPGIEVHPVETNIVNVDIKNNILEQIISKAKEQGVFIGSIGPQRIRLVTHLDIPSNSIQTIIHKLTNVFLQVNKGLE